MPSPSAYCYELLKPYCLCGILWDWLSYVMCVMCRAMFQVTFQRYLAGDILAGPVANSHSAATSGFIGD
jgi:hypothetical protein